MMNSLRCHDENVVSKDGKNFYWVCLLCLLLIFSCAFDIATTLKFSTHLKDLEANIVTLWLPVPFLYAFILILFIKVMLTVCFVIFVIYVNRIRRKGYGLFFKYNMFLVMLMVICLQLLAGYNNMSMNTGITKNINTQYNTSYEDINEIPIEKIEPFVLPKEQRGRMYILVVSLLGLFPYLYAMLSFLFFYKIVDFEV